MTKEMIAVVDAECKRVLAAIKLVTVRSYGEKREHHYVEGNKHSASLRRASMDLTRALAEMRKP